MSVQFNDAIDVTTSTYTYDQTISSVNVKWIDLGLLQDLLLFSVIGVLLFIATDPVSLLTR